MLHPTSDFHDSVHDTHKLTPRLVGEPSRAAWKEGLTLLRLHLASTGTMDPWHVIDRNDKSYVAQDVPKRM